tara:strand:+ start:467 stop:1423 length:957 start_codon:yes stop_codon:yes gene_type:complete
MDSTSIAPVALFAFNRPDLTSKVFEVIRAVKPPKLFLIMDGPRSGIAEDQELVAKTGEVLAAVDWECEVVRDYATSNLGLKRRITSGLDLVFASCDSAIILEDDCVADPSFFAFCSELLERYGLDPRVGTIGGSSRLRGQWISDNSYGFSRDIRIWGWATWARVWHEFSSSGDLDAAWNEMEQEEILTQLPSGPRRRSFRSMLEKAAKLDSWALPFAVHCMVRGYLSVVPQNNLVENIGFGNLSTHTKFEDFVAQVPAERISFPLVHPAQAQHDSQIDSLESKSDAREWIVYPLLHPFDVAARVMRFILHKLARSTHR